MLQFIPFSILYILLCSECHVSHHQKYTWFLLVCDTALYHTYMEWTFHVKSFHYQFYCVPITFDQTFQPLFKTDPSLLTNIVKDQVLVYLSPFIMHQFNWSSMIRLCSISFKSYQTLFTTIQHAPICCIEDSLLKWQVKETAKKSDKFVEVVVSQIGNNPLKCSRWKQILCN